MHKAQKSLVIHDVYADTRHSKLEMSVHFGRNEAFFLFHNRQTVFTLRCFRLSTKNSESYAFGPLAHDPTDNTFNVDELFIQLFVRTRDPVSGTSFPDHHNSERAI